MRSRRIGRSTLGLVSLALVLFACAKNPVTGRRQLSLMSESQELALGQQADAQVVQTYGIYDDPKLAAYVDGVGQKLAKVSHRPNLKFTFRVVDSPVINAFAIPGGYVYVTRGILEHMNNEAELAVVMGHEIGHVTARHGAQQYTQQQLAGLGLGLGSVLVPQIARFGQLAQTALGLMFLKYSRDDESQADELGVEYASRGGYDPTEGVKFFHVLERMTQESGQSLPGWLSTHPDPGDRVKRTAQLAAVAKTTHPNTVRVAVDNHMAQIDGAVHGDDPRQGFAEGSVFKHPALRFQIDFPGGWSVSNTPTAVMAIDSQKQAALQLTLEKSQGLSPRDYAARLVESAQGQLVSGRQESIHGFDAYVAEIQVPVQGGGSMPALATFAQREPGGSIYQIIGFGQQESAYQSHRNDFLNTMRSLQPLTDPRALNVQPNRVATVTVRSPTTFEQIVARESTAPVPQSVVALLNDLQPGSMLQPGSKVKVVRGTFRPPTATGGGQ